MVRGVDAWQRGRRPLAFVYGVVKKYGTDNGSSLPQPLTAADRQMLVAYAGEQRRTTDERVDVTLGDPEPDQATASAGPG